MIQCLLHLWPAPRPHRGEYRNTIRSIDVVRLARGMDLELRVRVYEPEEEVWFLEETQRELERQAS